MVDARDGKVLASHNADAGLPVASTTKLMTAYLALARLRPAQRLTAPLYRAKPAESLLGLEPGESDTVRDLLYGLLLPSGNDAAVDLADGVAGSVPAFVAMMNRAALRLGLTETHYTTPVGLDDPGNYSSARDLVALARILMRDSLFRRIVATRRATLRDAGHVRHVTNTNTLLSRAPFVDGIKTGTTNLAGDVLVSSGTRHGVTLVAALLGAPDEASRDAGSLALLRYGFSRYRERRAVSRGDVVHHVPARFTTAALSLQANRTIRVFSRADQRLEVRVRASSSVIGPIPEGTRIGSASVSLDGRPQGSVALSAASTLPAPVDPDGVGQAIPGSPGRALMDLIAAAILAAGTALLASAVFARRSRWLESTIE